MPGATGLLCRCGSEKSSGSMYQNSATLWGTKFAAGSVRVTPGIVGVPIRLDHVGTTIPFFGVKFAPPRRSPCPAHMYLRETSVLEPWTLFYGGAKFAASFGSATLRGQLPRRCTGLFPSEPCKPLKPGSLYMIFLVEKDVCIKRPRTCDYLNHEKFNWQYKVCTRTD